MTAAAFLRLARELEALEPAARSLAVEMLTPPPTGAVDSRRSAAILRRLQAGESPPGPWLEAAVLVQKLLDAGLAIPEPRRQTRPAYLEAAR